MFTVTNRGENTCVHAPWIKSTGHLNRHARRVLLLAAAHSTRFKQRNHLLCAASRLTNINPRPPFTIFPIVRSAATKATVGILTPRTTAPPLRPPAAWP